MKYLSYAQTLHDLNLFKDQGMSEVILGHKDFSRFGKLNDHEFHSLANRARELGLRVLLEWDILMTESVFTDVSQKIKSFLPEVDALRVQDPGALEWSIKNTLCPIQFIAENGNHNIEALKGWIEHAQGRIERIALSIELSKNVIAQYVKELSVPCELLGLGRILLFYTPRSLLSPLKGEAFSQNEELMAVGESEESPHKGFPIVENKHGTFMFHIKEFCLIEFAKDLQEMGLTYFRIDIRWENVLLIPKIVSLCENYNSHDFETFKNEYSQDFMRGFYLVNKTDVLFPKLKNHRLQKREGDYVGEVLEVEKGSHMAILIKNTRGLKKSDKLKVLHPKGEVFEVGIFTLRNLSLEDIEFAPAQTIALIQAVNGVWVKSQVFYND